MPGFVDLHDTVATAGAGWVGQATGVRFEHDKLPAARVSFEVEEAWAPFLRPGPEALLPTMLVLAARLGDDLRVDVPVHPAVRAAVADAHALQAAWWGWRPAALVAPEGSVPTPAQPAGRGLCFTSGVDSWGTLLDLEAEGRPPTHLVTIDGDVHLPPAVRRTAVDLVARVAAERGLPQVVVRTDLRATIDPHTEWGRHAHGAALAGVGHLLSGGLGSLTIGSTNWWPDATPYGSHPGLDPRWSVPWLAVDHHGADEARWQRVVRVSAHRPAAEALQVCWTGSTDANCGRCAKCTHTLASLVLGGHRGWEGRFRTTFDPRQVDDVPAVAAAVTNGLLEHCDLVGLAADPLRQRWEAIPNAPADRDDYRRLPLQQRVQVTALDGHAPGPELVRVAGRALAPLGLRLDHAVGTARHGSTPPLAEPVGPDRGDGPVLALVATDGGLRDGAGRSLEGALAAAGVTVRPDLAFDPDGQPPAVAGWKDLRQREVAWARAGRDGPRPTLHG